MMHRARLTSALVGVMLVVVWLVTRVRCKAAHAKTDLRRSNSQTRLPRGMVEDNGHDTILTQHAPMKSRVSVCAATPSHRGAECQRHSIGG